MTLEVTDLIPVSLEDTDKYIKFADGHHVMAKQKVSVQIQMCNDNGKKFIATLYNVLLAPDLCDRLFSIITLMNAGHTCLFTKGFLHYVVMLPHFYYLLRSTPCKTLCGKYKYVLHSLTL